MFRKALILLKENYTIHNDLYKLYTTYAEFKGGNDELFIIVSPQKNMET